MTDEQKIDDALLAFHTDDLEQMAIGVSPRIKALAERVAAGEVDAEKALRGCFAVAWKVGAAAAVETIHAFAGPQRGERSH